MIASILERAENSACWSVCEAEVAVHPVLCIILPLDGGLPNRPHPGPSPPTPNATNARGFAAPLHLAAHDHHHDIVSALARLNSPQIDPFDDGEHALLQHSDRCLPDHPRLRTPPISSRLLNFLRYPSRRPSSTIMDLHGQFATPAVERQRVSSSEANAASAMNSEVDRPHPQSPSTAVGSVSRPPGTPTSTTAATARRKNYSIGAGKQITRTRVSYSCHTCRRRKVKCDKVHPICGNCVKNGSECHYDSRSLHQSRPSSSSAHDLHLHQHSQYHQSRTKRRRETSKPAETSLAEILSPYADHLHGSHGLGLGLGEQRPPGSSQEIAARLDRLTSMIERLSRTNGSVTPQEHDPLFQGMRSLYEASEQSASELRLGGRLTGSGSSRSMSRQPSPRRQSEDSESNEDFPMPTGLATDLVDPVGTLNLGHLSLEDGGKSRYILILGV